MIHFSQNIFSYLLMLGLLCLSAFFSGSETALFSLSPEATRNLQGDRKFREILRLVRREPSELLTAILFGNLIVNILFFCTGAVVAGQWGEAYGEWAEALGGLVILLLVILFGEIAPKAVGLNHAPAVVVLTSLPLRLWFTVTLPFRRLIRWLLRRFALNEESPSVTMTPGELKELLSAVEHEPGFGTPEKEIVEDIVNLSAVRVREVMVPRVQVLRKPLETPRAELIEEARAGEYSCILMYRDSDDDPLGYIRLRDLVAADVSPESLLQPLLFVPETRRADALLRDFMADGRELTAVVDEYGGLAGIVTIEDLFEEVIGDLEPETAEITQLDETTYRLHGQLSIRAWRELFTGFIPGPEMESMAFDTLGGLMISLLGRMPRNGDSVMVRNLRLTVESMHHRRVESVLLHLAEPGEAA